MFDGWSAAASLVLPTAVASLLPSCLFLDCTSSHWRRRKRKMKDEKEVQWRAKVQSSRQRRLLSVNNQPLWTAVTAAQWCYHAVVFLFSAIFFFFFASGRTVLSLCNWNNFARVMLLSEHSNGMVQVASVFLSFRQQFLL